VSGRPEGFLARQQFLLVSLHCNAKLYIIIMYN
jgi:hypothetical protein